MDYTSLLSSSPDYTGILKEPELFIFLFSGSRDILRLTKTVIRKNTYNYKIPPNLPLPKGGK